MNSGRASANALAAADYAGWAFVYGLLLVVMGFILAGAGHGVGSFFDVSLSGLILWPIAGAAIVRADRPVGRAVFVVAMWLHYLHAMAILSGTEEGIYWDRIRAVAGWLVVAFVVIYLTGQVMLWKAFVSRARRAIEA
jgi:hypothetical protein